MFCPLHDLEKQCDRVDCAWWDKTEFQCAEISKIKWDLEITKALELIAQRLKDIDVAFRHVNNIRE